MAAASSNAGFMDFAGKTATCSPYLTPEQSFDVGHPRTPSSIRAKVIDPLIGDGWEGAVANHPQATIFHSNAWAKVLSETYGHKPHYLALVKGETPIALLPFMEVKSAFTGHRGVCLPFSDFCGPLIFGENGLPPSTIDHLASVARDHGWKYFELRAALPPEIGAAVRETFYGHHLELNKTPSQLFDAFASSVRRAIRKAERSALSVEIVTDLAAIRDFYRLHNQTRRRHGIPPQPFSFFRNIYRHVIQRDLGFLVLACLGGQPVAGAMFFHFGRQAIFKFGASDDRHQEHRPNNLVMWEGIQRCAQLGLTRLSLGRTDFEHTGLRRFKLSMGAEEEVLHYHRFATAEARWMNARPSTPSQFPGAIFRRLPLTVNMLAGTVLYPHMH